MSPPDDKQAFIAAVAVRHGPRLRRYLAARLHNTSDAPDIAQEVYLRLLRMDEVEVIRNPEAYLITIASHLLHEHTLRQAALPPTIELEDLAAEIAPLAEDSSAQVDAQRRIEELERALGQLSPKAQAALVLHRRDGFSLEEVARQIGVSRNVAKKHLARALLHCRRKLGAR